MTKLFNHSMIVLVLMSLPGAVAAQSASVHEMNIHPQADFVPLEIGTWLTSTSNYTFTVVSPPSFGSLIGEEYHPSDEFWNAGGDRLVLSVTNMAQFQQALHTVLLTPAQPTVINSHEVNFDSPTPPAGWTVVDANSLLSHTTDSLEVIEGLGSLEIAPLGVGSAGYWQRTDDPVGGGTSASAASGQSEVVEPPYWNDPCRGIVVAIGDAKVVFEYLGDHWEIHASVDNGTTCTPCTTPSRTVPGNTPILYRLWSGKTGIFSESDGVTSPRMLRFDVDFEDQDPLTVASTDWIEGEFDFSSPMVGLVESVSCDHRILRADTFRTWTEDVVYESLGYHTDGAEEGTPTGWNIDGPITVGTDAAISGNYGFEVEIDDIILPGGAFDNAMLIDPSPVTSKAVTAFMRLDVSDLDLLHTELLQLIRGSGHDGFLAALNLSLALQRRHGVYRLRVRTLDDQGLTKQAAWHPLPVGSTVFDIAVRWQASDAPGANNGAVTLWVDGEEVSSRSDIDNDTHVVQALAFGSHRPMLSSTVHDRGTLYFDDLAAFRFQPVTYDP